MSGNEITQQQREDNLQSIWWDFTKIMIFFCGGWILLMFGIIFNKAPLEFLALLVAGGPIALKLITGAKFGSLFKPDYEVVTETQSGRTSDRGAQSMGNNIILMIFLAIIMLIIGIVIQLIRAIIFGFKYIHAYTKVNKKPVFFRGITFVILISLGVLIGSPVVFTVINKAQKTIEKAANDRFRQSSWKGMEAFVYSETPAGERTVNLRAEANGQSRVIKTLNEGSNVTLTDGREDFWVQVNADGTEGWVFGLNLRFKDRDIRVFNVETPFLVKAVSPVERFTGRYSDPEIIPQGAELKVSRIHAGFGYDYNNSNGVIYNDTIEQLQYVGPAK